MKNQERDLLSYKDARSIKPDFLAIRKPAANWTLTVKLTSGAEERISANDWVVESMFGRYEPKVVAVNGVPIYDTIQHTEAPCVNIVVWGRDENNQVMVAELSQYRDHPQDPEAEKQGIVFSQTPMGFMDEKDGVMEDPKYAAIREAREETGANAIKNVVFPQAPFHFPTVNSKTPETLAFVEVDLKGFNKLKESVGEMIVDARFIPLKQLWKEIRDGRTEHGITRLATSNSAILVWLSNLGKLYRDSKDRDILLQNSSL